MSRVNGDKARFNRERKKRIAQRMRNRKMIEAIDKVSPTATKSSGKKPKATVA